MLGIPQFCNLFVCGKRLHSDCDFLSVVYRVLPSDNLCLITVILWENNKIYGAMLILVSYMINEVKHVVVLLVLHLEPNHRKRKTTRLKKIHLKSTLRRYVTLASKNCGRKFCYITIEILFWSSIIGVLTLEQYRLFISACSWRQPSLNYKLLAVLSFFFKGVVVRYLIPKSSSIVGFCSISLGLFCNLLQVTTWSYCFARLRVPRCFARDSAL